MKTSTRLKALLLAWLCAVTLWAAVPFRVTTVTDGKFAESTTWYTITIGAGKLLVADNGTATSLQPTQALYDGSDDILWCFTGSDAEGYTLYNKKAGAAKVLASPATLVGDGGTSFPILKAINALSGEVTRYDFAPSTNIEGGFYISQHGRAANAMNLYSGKSSIAFWTGGRDANSTFLIAPALGEVDIVANDGSFAGTGNWSSSFTSNTRPAVTISCGGINNIARVTNRAPFDMRSGTSGTSTYNITAPQDYRITAYTMKMKLVGAGTVTVKAGDGQEQTITAEGITVSQTVGEEESATFVLKGDNVETSVEDIKVSIERVAIEIEDQINVIPTRPGDIATRIPAIATAQNGNVIVVADYRHPGAGADIGMATNGRLDLRFTLSKDNGKTWSDIKALVTGRGAAAAGQGDEMWVAFGDPIAIGDRESSRILVMSCCGNVSFPDGTRERHQGIARFYSDDNGETWSDPVNIAEPLYQMLDKRKDGPIKAMFIGSGKASQSKYIKVGTHYRIYCAALARLNSGASSNFVFYSDDFGQTWDFLGGVDADPIPTGGNEPKAEELPDGSVIISSRTAYGRRYNIFHYSNAEKAEGAWGKMAFSGKENNGTEGLQDANGTNGEILILPVVRKADNEKMFLALQSLPFGPQRSNVGIYYKELASLDDFADAAAIAKDWDGRHQASYMSSAYSTMTLQHDNHIGFVYEETTLGATYTIAYKNYSIETITDSLYSYCTEPIDSAAFVAAKVDNRVTALLDAAHFGTRIGQYKEEGRARLQSALDAYKASPSQALYQALNAAIQHMPCNEIEAGRWYRLHNHEHGYNLKALPATASTAAGYIGVKPDETAEDQVFQFRTNDDGTYTIYNAAINLNLSRTLGTSVAVPAVRRADDTGRYTVTSSAEGESYFTCMNSTGGYNNLHMDAQKKLVAWTASGSPASLWYIEPSDLTPAVPSAWDNLQAAVYEANRFMKTHTEGTTFGLYDYTDLRKAVADAADLTADSPEEQLQAAMEQVYDAIDHCPMKGNNAFLRIKSASAAYAANVPYLASTNATGQTKAAYVTDGTKANTVFYYSSDHKLLAYDNGLYLADNSNFAGYGNAETPASLVLFNKTSGTDIFNVMFNNGARALYCQFKNNVYYADAGNSVGQDDKYTFRIEMVDALPVTLPAGGHKALYTPVALTVPAGMAAYAVTVADGAATATEITGTIPAGTGVILKGAAGSYLLPIADRKAEAVPSSLLGQLDAATVAAQSRYVFGIVNGTPGFYKNTTTAAGGFTPYLPPADGIESYPLTLPVGITDTMTDAEESTALYDLSGRRVVAPEKGVFITRNGQKIIKK